MALGDIYNHFRRRDDFMENNEKRKLPIWAIWALGGAIPLLVS